MPVQEQPVPAVPIDTPAEAGTEALTLTEAPLPPVALVALPACDDVLLPVAIDTFTGAVSETLADGTVTPVAAPTAIPFPVAGCDDVQPHPESANALEPKMMIARIPPATSAANRMASRTETILTIPPVEYEFFRHEV